MGQCSAKASLRKQVAVNETALHPRGDSHALRETQRNFREAASERSLRRRRQRFEGIFPPETTDEQIRDLLTSGYCRMPVMISCIRFSQGSIHPGFTGGPLLRQAVRDWEEEGWRSDVSVIRAVLFLGRKNVTVVSWDNRRLAVLRHLNRKGQYSSIEFDVFLAQTIVSEPLKRLDVTLTFPAFRQVVTPPQIVDFLRSLGVQDGGVRDFRKTGIPKGHKPETWGAMVFCRTLSQRSFFPSFPLAGTLRVPVASLDREQAYEAYVEELKEYKVKVETEAEASGQEPVYQARGFDFQGNPTIFDCESIEGLNKLLRRLPDEQLLRRIPYLAEWCSQVYEGLGFAVPPLWDQVLTEEEASHQVEGLPFDVAVIKGQEMYLQFRAPAYKVPISEDVSLDFSQIADCQNAPFSPRSEPDVTNPKSRCGLGCRGFRLRPGFSSTRRSKRSSGIIIGSRLKDATFGEQAPHQSPHQSHVMILVAKRITYCQT